MGAGNCKRRQPSARPPAGGAKGTSTLASLSFSLPSPAGAPIGPTQPETAGKVGLLMQFLEVSCMHPATGRRRTGSGSGRARGTSLANRQ